MSISARALKKSSFSVEVLIGHAKARTNPISPEHAITVIYATPTLPVHLYDEISGTEKGEGCFDNNFIHIEYAGFEPLWHDRGHTRHGNPSLSGNLYLLTPPSAVISGVSDGRSNWYWELIICDQDREGSPAELLREPRELIFSEPLPKTEPLQVEV